jgi:hypothetical protein
MLSKGKDEEMNIQNNSPEDKNNTSQNQLKNELKWLTRMLPFITKIILALIIFFFSATVYQLFSLNNRVDNAPQLTVEQSLLENVSDKDTHYQWKTLIVLESHALQQRYHQANVLLMARIWVRYLGFVTGMMLAIIGAIFVLGKLRESNTEMAVGGSVQVQIVTQSPGIILVLLGSTIMLTTILNHPRISVMDAPIYIPQSFSLTNTDSRPTSLEEIDNFDDSDELMMFLENKQKEEDQKKAKGEQK